MGVHNLDRGSSGTPARPRLGGDLAAPPGGTLEMTVRKVALLTAGGLAPCLSSAVGGLIERYTLLAPDVEIIAYRDGYHGLLSGNTVEVTPEIRERAGLLHRFGGSPIGNS